MGVLARSILTLALCIGAQFPVTSWAQSGGPPGLESEALLLFEAGVSAYRAGRYDTAIERFQEAYTLSPEPVLLYNLARAQDRHGLARAALGTYRRYLLAANHMDVAERVEIEARVAELEASVGPDDGEPDPTRPVPPQSSGSAGLPIAGATLALGALGVGAGGILAFLAQSRYDTAVASMVNVVRIESQAQANDFALGANVAFGVGGGIALIGFIWLLVEIVQAQQQPPPPPRMRTVTSLGVPSLHVDPTGLTVRF